MPMDPQRRGKLGLIGPLGHIVGFMVIDTMVSLFREVKKAKEKKVAKPIKCAKCGKKSQTPVLDGFQSAVFTIAGRTVVRVGVCPEHKDSLKEVSRRIMARFGVELPA